MTKLKTITLNPAKIEKGHICYTPSGVISGAFHGIEDMSICIPSRPRITNCKNCGAPLHGNRCEYCGTEY